MSSSQELPFICLISQSTLVVLWCPNSMFALCQSFSGTVFDSRIYKKGEDNTLKIISNQVLSPIFVCMSLYIIRTSFYYYSADSSIFSSASFFVVRLRIARLRFGFSSTGVSGLTPANSGSINMRPQYSQTIIFLCILISNCL